MAKAYSSNQTVVNLSGKCLSENDISALNRGFTMSLPQKMNSIEIKTNTEAAFKQIYNNEKELPREDIDRVKTKMESFACNLIHKQESSNQQEVSQIANLRSLAKENMFVGAVRSAT